MRRRGLSCIPLTALVATAATIALSLTLGLDLAVPPPPAGAAADPPAAGHAARLGWREVATAAKHGPAARSGAALAYDPLTRQLLLYGGATGGLGASSVLGDTWSWSGGRWSRLHPRNSPPPRTGASFAYDPQTRQLVLFGGAAWSPATGSARAVFLADTWAWDGSDWTQLHPKARPAARTNAAMGFDAASGQLILFGGVGHGAGGLGGTAPTALADTWTWTGITWVRLVPALSPPPHRAAGLAYQPESRSLVLTGGQADSPAPLADSWAWTGATWKRLAAPAFGRRSGPATAYDPAVGRLVLFGGGGELRLQSDTWAGAAGAGGATTTWSRVATSGPRPRTLAAIAYDPVAGELFLFGGLTAAGVGFAPSSETWVFAAPAATAVARTRPERARAGAAAPDAVPVALSAASVNSSRPAHDGAGHRTSRRTRTLPARRDPRLAGWSPPARLEADDGTPTAVSCPAVTSCLAVTETGWAIPYGASGWQEPVRVDDLPARAAGYSGGGAGVGLDAVSCAASTLCVAVDGEGRAITYDGGFWQPPAQVYAGGVLTGISCAPPGYCVAVGHPAGSRPPSRRGLALVYDGEVLGGYDVSAWSEPALVDATEPLVTVSCPLPSARVGAALFCLAGDPSARVATFDGSTWAAPRSVGPLGGLTSVACWSSGRCVATNGRVAATDNGGRWSSPALLDAAAGAAGAVSCAGAALCLEVDRAGSALLLRGGRWQPSRLADRLGSPVAVACAPAGRCMVVDSAGDGIHFGGSSFGSPATISPLGTMRAVSCASQVSCVAVDGASNAFVMRGTAWSRPELADPRGAIESVSCPLPAFCAAVDDRGGVVTFGGARWGPRRAVDPGKSLVAVSCASSRFCLAADASGDALTFDGARWSPPRRVAAGAITSVSCPSPAGCTVTTELGTSLVMHGGAWGRPLPTGIQPIGISCASLGWCVAVDSSGDATVFGGRSWSRPSLVDRVGVGGNVTSISCAPARRCSIVDERPAGTGSRGWAVTYSGGAWNAPALVDATAGLSSVSCPTKTFCLAADEDGDVLAAARAAAPRLDSRHRAN